jgi:hypothetical protein
MKTPKEEAEHMLYQFRWDGEGYEEECFFDFAKEGALFAVNMFINHLEIMTVGLQYSQFPQAFDLLEYYRNVKVELELMKFEPIIL